MPSSNCPLSRLKLFPVLDMDAMEVFKLYIWVLYCVWPNSQKSLPLPDLLIGFVALTLEALICTVHYFESSFHRYLASPASTPL